jgi:propanol-preferring alcohol dehydrogenase
MVLAGAGRGGLQLSEREPPSARRGELLVKVLACGVCRTDLHVVDGELPGGQVPIVPGHEIVGRVEQTGDGVAGFTIGERVGIPWLASSCNLCGYCRTRRENLCPEARFTGYHRDGGYADYTIADARYVCRIPDSYGDAEAAPLLCAGLIGYRSYRMAGEASRLALYGFGAAAHIITQIAVHEAREVYAFTRPADLAAQEFARRLGAVWAGSSTDPPPRQLDAAIIFAPVGALVPQALGHVVPGGSVVCAGIHMSEIPSFPYRLLWEERSLRSVANLTRQDAHDFMALAARVPIKTSITTYALADANRALDDVRDGRLQGAAVLIP